MERGGGGGFFYVLPYTGRIIFIFECYRVPAYAYVQYKKKTTCEKCVKEEMTFYYFLQFALNT